MKLEIPKDKLKLILLGAFVVLTLSIALFLYNGPLALSLFFGVAPTLILFVILPTLLLYGLLRHIKSKKPIFYSMLTACLLIFIIWSLMCLGFGPVCFCPGSGIPCDATTRPVGGYREFCQMPAGMNCMKAYLSSQTDKLDITLNNGWPKDIVVTNISCTKNESQYEAIDAILIPLGEFHSFTLTCNDENGSQINFEQGEAYGGKINVQYYLNDEGPSMFRLANGQITVKAK